MTRMLYSSMLCLLASITLVAGGVSIADAAQRGGTSATTAGVQKGTSATSSRVQGPRPKCPPCCPPLCKPITTRK
jgi:hypothetical protein